MILYSYDYSILMEAVMKNELAQLLNRTQLYLNSSSKKCDSIQTEYDYLNSHEKIRHEDPRHYQLTFVDLIRECTELGIYRYFADNLGIILIDISVMQDMSIFSNENDVNKSLCKSCNEFIDKLQGLVADIRIKIDNTDPSDMTTQNFARMNAYENLIPLIDCFIHDLKVIINRYV